MKKILAAGLFLMVFVGLWLAITGYIEPSRPFSMMIVLGLLGSIVLAVTYTAEPKWVLVRGYIIGVVESEETATTILTSLDDSECFAMSITDLAAISTTALRLEGKLSADKQDAP